MIIGNPSSASIAASVWAFTGTKGITALAAAGTPITGVPSVAAAAILDLRPAAGKIRACSFDDRSGGAAWLFGDYDGTTFRNISTIAIDPPPSTVWCGPGTGLAVKNNNAGAQSFRFMGVDWS